MSKDAIEWSQFAHRTLLKLLLLVNMSRIRRLTSDRKVVHGTHSPEQLVTTVTSHSRPAGITRLLLTITLYTKQQPIIMHDSSMSLIDCIKTNDVTMDFIELKLVTSESLQVSCTNKSVLLSHQDDIQAFLQVLKNSTVIEALKLCGEFKDEHYLSCQVVVCAVAKQLTIKRLECDVYPGFQSSVSFMVYSLTNLKELVLYSYGALQDYEAIEKRL
jgi:hypothetical protein